MAIGMPIRMHGVRWQQDACMHAAAVQQAVARCCMHAQDGCTCLRSCSSGCCAATVFRHASVCGLCGLSVAAMLATSSYIAICVMLASYYSYS